MEDKKDAVSAAGQISEDQWERISGKRIFFGHQSVGENIMQGIRELLKEETTIRLSIKETRDPRDFDSPVFAHSRIGKNEDPKSKCEDFAKAMETGLGGKVDISFFKFCYVDFTSSTDVEKMFMQYRRTLSAMKGEYPRTTFIHVTAPLTIVQTGYKASLKKIIGKPVIGENANVKRTQFNDMLRKEYGGKEPIFDLAEIESVRPDGKPAFFEKEGKNYPFLVPDYTNDGGHLNPLGRKMVAKRLISFLATIHSVSTSPK